MKQLQTLKSDLNQSRIVLEQLGDDIQEGEVLLKVEKFSFTSNNVTYGVAGDTIGYWNFFPAINNPDNTWGCIPVWGFAEVMMSRNKFMGNWIFYVGVSSRHLVDIQNWLAHPNLIFLIKS